MKEINCEEILKKHTPKLDADYSEGWVKAAMIEAATEAAKAQREVCAFTLSLSSAVWNYPKDSEKIKEWILNAPEPNIK